MNPNKYKSVAIKIGTWNVATDLSQKIVPNTTLSRSKIVEIAVANLAKSVSASNQIKLIDFRGREFVNGHQVSHKKLIKQ